MLREDNLGLGAQIGSSRAVGEVAAEHGGQERIEDHLGTPKSTVSHAKIVMDDTHWR